MLFLLCFLQSSETVDFTLESRDIFLQLLLLVRPLGLLTELLQLLILLRHFTHKVIHRSTPDLDRRVLEHLELLLLHQHVELVVELLLECGQERVA
ncbi:uncharacterized protein PG998_005421 [Apiospora kogelbergensis]|uniref:Secreted protein n=1 Tax=Apiospora kogelbergensis TaxID=1337665 RepID=A0AAW0QJZ3_9PEZI